LLAIQEISLAPARRFGDAPKTRGFIPAKYLLVNRILEPRSILAKIEGTLPA
jgi:hypothetical protein